MEMQEGVNRLMQDETENILHHINAALPKELAESLSKSGELKEKLLGYFERNVHALGMQTTGLTELLEQAGGEEKFNTAEVEKSLTNMYGHLRGHIQRGIIELERETNTLLRQNTGQGAFIRGDKAYTVVKSSFRDNPERPQTVTDLKLCINIPESELVTPIFHYQVTAEYLIKDILAKNITDTVDREIAALRDERLDEGLEELTDAEILTGKLQILDRLRDTSENDPPDIGENLEKIVDSEYIRNRGFNTAVNSLSTILDNSRLGFQCIENFKNARELRIREYDDAAPPLDEHYQIRMRYCDGAQLREECTAYDVQMQRFEAEITDLLLQTGELARKGHQEPREGISFVKPGETDVEKMNPTYAYEKERITARIKGMREMIRGTYGSYRYPPERRALEDRLNFLEKEYIRFDYEINPYHLQPGLVLDVDVTSIKRRRITLDAMSRALNEFLQSISRGFQDPAFSEGTSSGSSSFGDLLSGVSDNEIKEI
ncbi:cytochrome c oxidase subunit II [Spirochaetia bacterium]|nr:cytochrome c oxidase subunit II [Spirochaetia bacterium]